MSSDDRNRINRCMIHMHRTTCGVLSATVSAVLILCALLSVPSGAAASPVEVHRALQANLDGLAVGSDLKYSSGFATLPQPGITAKSVVVAPIASLSRDFIDGITSQDVSTQGLVVVLPANYKEDALESADTERIQQLEEILLTTRVPTPVYFAVDNPSLQSLITALQVDLDAGKVATAQTGGFLVTIKGDYQLAVKRHQVVNFAGMLHAAQVASRTAAKAPIILVTANYDSFAAAPGLAVGADSNASGMVALLQLLRTFRRMYTSPATRGRYNILFLATGGGQLAGEGLHQWLNSADASLLENIEFALCLDSLGATAETGQLYLHYSKPPKEEAVAAWYEGLERGAAAAGVTLTQVQKKINVASRQLSWPHEHFSRRRILSATLSARPTPTPPFQPSSILDTNPRATPPSLHLATKAAAEFLAHATYPQAPADMHLVNLNPPSASPSSTPPNSADPVTAFFTQWLDLLCTTPRVTPFYPPTHPLNAALLGFFRDHSDETIDSVWELPEARLAFASAAPAPMTWDRRAGLHVDCAVLLMTLAYLAALFAALRVATRGWGELVSVFVAVGKRPRRSAAS